jgi:hypothetical protein
VAEAVFSGSTTLVASGNDYDWLGHGIYFWEHSAQRAFEFACELLKHPRPQSNVISHPAVIGAVIDLGSCLNLLDSRFVPAVRQAYEDLEVLHDEAGEPLPENTGGKDKLLRQLDCAVIQLLHSIRNKRGDPPFDSVRAAFIEGTPIYDDAGFHEKNHIQLCVRAAACIKGYFRPLDDAGRLISFVK